MNNKDLKFDRTCHTLYSKQCEKEIKNKIAAHYKESEREEVRTKVQLKYVELLKNLRTDLGGKRIFQLFIESRRQYYENADCKYRL